MAKTLRIAILECDTPLDVVKTKFGKYGNIFGTLLKAGAERLKHPSEPEAQPPSSTDTLPTTNGTSLPSSSKAISLDLEITGYDVVTAQSYPDLSSIDAILISGSKHTAFDNDPWILKLVEYVKRALATTAESNRGNHQVRVIGVCFGHQIIARAVGAPLGRSALGWEVAVTPLELTKLGQEIFGRPAIALHQMHRDIVESYPPPSELGGVEIQSLATSAKCETQGMYVPGRLITVQGHPEFNGEIVKTILNVRHGMGIFDDETWKGGLERVDRYHDGVVVAEAFLRFCLA